MDKLTSHEWAPIKLSTGQGVEGVEGAFSPIKVSTGQVVEGVAERAWTPAPHSCRGDIA